MGDGMEGRKKGAAERPPLILMVSAALVIVVVVFSTWWFVEASQTATVKSVHDVSEFYLKELSEQTSRLMQTNLNEWKKELQVVIKGIRAEDLTDFRALQEYISKMKENNQFDFLAMVDEL